MDDWLDTAQLVCAKTDEKNNNFSNFTFPSKFASLPMMNTVNTEFSYIEVWFTNQNSNALEIEDNVNLTLIIG